MTRRTVAAELLQMLREAGDVLSGEQASRRLGVSRAAVWKQVEALRASGYTVVSIPARGYRLTAEPERLDPELLQRLLRERCLLLGRRLVWLDTTVSTNLEAFRRADEGAAEGTVVLADHQSGGKGRLGRQWESPPGVNLYASVILRPQLAPYDAPQLTFLSAVATARAIQQTCGLQPSIKWPNDLLLRGRKVAGLLNEMHAETDRVGFVVLGIGVNLNMGAAQFPADLRTPATSLCLETGTWVSRTSFALQLIMELDRAYEEFRCHGFDPVRAEWSRLCNAAGRKVEVDSGGSVTEGFFDGVDHDGALLIRLADGGRERILSGDVRIV